MSVDSEFDIGRCDLCGSEDGERQQTWWAGAPVWICARCEADPDWWVAA